MKNIKSIFELVHYQTNTIRTYCIIQLVCFYLMSASLLTISFWLLLFMLFLQACNHDVLVTILICTSNGIGSMSLRLRLFVDFRRTWETIIACIVRGWIFCFIRTWIDTESAIINIYRFE